MGHNGHQSRNLAGLMTRMAVVVWPPPDIIETVARLRREPGINWSKPAQWMIKLRPLGHVSMGLVEPLADALKNELADAEPADCVLGPETRRLGGQWLGVPVRGLDDLAAAAFDATVELVPVTHPQPFQADIVVARGKVPASLAGAAISGHWRADTVCLVADRSGPAQPKFENLAEFPL
jgi:2'-5' RNA ligase